MAFVGVFLEASTTQSTRKQGKDAIYSLPPPKNMSDVVNPNVGIRGISGQSSVSEKPEMSGELGSLEQQ